MNVAKKIIVIGFLIGFFGLARAGGDDWGNTDLMNAARAGDIVRVNALLEQPGLNVDDTDDDGMTALIWAAGVAPEGVVERLLDAGADINAANILGLTALMWAVVHGRVEAVRMLLERGANPSAIDRFGNTALIMAVESGNEEITELIEEITELIEQGIRWVDRKAWLEAVLEEACK